MSYECILKCDESSKSLDTISQHWWESFSFKIENWPGLDKFGEIYTISWIDCTRNCYMYQTCYISVLSSDKFEYARQHKIKQSDIFLVPSYTSNSEMQARNTLWCWGRRTIVIQVPAFDCTWSSPWPNQVCIVWCMKKQLAIDRKCDEQKASGSLMLWEVVRAMRLWSRALASVKSIFYTTWHHGCLIESKKHLPT